MAINFPSNPTLNETFTHTDPPSVVVYKWDGTSWIAISGLGSETSISTLGDLSDVSDLAKTNLDILTWFSANSTWAPGESGSFSFDGQFSSLTGVPTTIAGYGITDAFGGDYNNLTNKPSLVTSLNNLSDVNTLSITPQTADVLSWTANNTWEPQLPTSSGSMSIGSLDDVDASASSSSADLDILTWFSGEWKPLALDTSGFVLITQTTVDNHLNKSSATSSQVLSWNGSDYAWVSNSGGDYDNGDVDTHLNQSNPTSGHVLSWNGSDYAWVSNSGGGYVNGDVDTHLNVSLANSGQVLSWNGTDYTWSNPAGSSTQARESRFLMSSSTIADGGSFDMDFTTINTTPNAIFVPHSYLLQKITTDYSAWVVLYTSSTARTNDSTRLINQDPEPGSGVVLEVVTTATSLEQLITPGVMGFNENITGPDTGTLFFKIVNLSGAQQQITLTLDYLPLEWS